ncbi:hypothetical protein P3T76_002634 [Phytophthora citrophthora]|uniref:DUF6604 domain-containing protein n=1 Tax=Phytophthora citrophthora TaxID=4793 RepID=A0AAD9GWY8_9STRA|nr:hypothetical protein P3T76_002634 [Phytophthora citrophthora]
MSFPVGKYARYKRSTAYFLDWLLQVRVQSDQHVHLETLNEVVQEIAADSSILTTKLLQELPKALAACHYAITLREHVSNFFPDDDEGQEGHRHFLDLLRSWYQTLKEVQIQPEAMEEIKFKNYYEVLQSEEDFYPDEDIVVESPVRKKAKTGRDRLFDEAFIDEMEMEVLSFFVELDDIMQGVYQVYVDAKMEKRTLVEATVVVKLAMDGACALTAQLQLKYPSLVTGQDMYDVVKNTDPVNFGKRMASIHSKYLAGLQDSLVNGNGVAPYIPGMFLLDFVGVGTTLDSFLTAVPVDTTKSINFPPQCFGEAYGEDRTPEYVLLPSPSTNKVFLLQQLPLLHKTIVEKRIATGSGYDSSSPANSFMVLMEDYFTTREVKVPTVFACICWMKSVAALQGDGGLGRNVSLSFSHSNKLMKNIEVTVEKGGVRKAHKKTDEFLQLCANEIKRSRRNRYLSRVNPLQAGFTMLDHHFKYLHMSSEVLLVTSRFRSFGHLYNALVQENYLEHIPFLDDLLEIYSEMIFTPSRASAVRGAYYRALLLSIDLRTNSVDAVCRGEVLPAGNGKFRKRKQFHLSDLSKTYRLIVKQDKSVLEGASWSRILTDAVDICSRELFETRVLSRDLLKLNDDLVDVFAELLSEFKQNRSNYELPCQNQQQRELEDGVIMLLLQLLDIPQPDSENPIPSTNFCKKAAAVIRNKFRTCELSYFTFPTQPDWISQEFGSMSFEMKEGNETREGVFCKLWKLLQESNEPLTGEDRRYFISEIKKDPQLLGMTIDPVSNDHPEHEDLCTLLHQAAAGPAHDVDLVEWMIQMGALILQPSLHCRTPMQKDLARKSLPSTMAVHCAAIAGHEDITQILLEADNFVDLNTPTLHTKETLAHLAVKHGHKGLLNTLVWFGADLLVQDGCGRRVWAGTSDADWARSIVAYAVRANGSTSGGIDKRNNRVSSQKTDQQSTAVKYRTRPSVVKRLKSKSIVKKTKNAEKKDEKPIVEPFLQQRTSPSLSCC